MNLNLKNSFANIEEFVAYTSNFEYNKQLVYLIDYMNEGGKLADLNPYEFGFFSFTEYIQFKDWLCNLTIEGKKLG